MSWQTFRQGHYVGMRFTEYPQNLTLTASSVKIKSSTLWAILIVGWSNDLANQSVSTGKESFHTPNNMENSE